MYLYVIADPSASLLDSVHDVFHCFLVSAVRSRSLDLSATENVKAMSSHYRKNERMRERVRE